MKISEVMKRLTVIKAAHGDIDVDVMAEFDGYLEVKDITKVKHRCEDDMWHSATIYVEVEPIK